MRNPLSCDTRVIKQFFLLTIFLVFSLVAFSQQKRVAGKIVNSTTSQPVESATITGKVSKVATLTNAEGSFSLMVPSNETGLVISSVGFETQEVSIGADAGNISVSLR